MLLLLLMVLGLHLFRWHCDRTCIEVNLAEGRSHASLDAEHLSEGRLISMLDFKRTPSVPELRIVLWVCELTGVGEKRSRSVNLTQFPLKLCIIKAECFALLVADLRPLYELLIHLAHFADAEEVGRLGDIQSDDLHHLVAGYR